MGGLRLAGHGFGSCVCHNGCFDLKPRRVALRLKGETRFLSNPGRWKGGLSQGLVKKSQTPHWLPGAEMQYP